MIEIFITTTPKSNICSSCALRINGEILQTESLDVQLNAGEPARINATFYVDDADLTVKVDTIDASKIETIKVL